MNDRERTATLTLLDPKQGRWQLDWYYYAGGREAPKLSPSGLTSLEAQDWADKLLGAITLIRPGSIWVSNRDETIWTAHVDVGAGPSV